MFQVHTHETISLILLHHPCIKVFQASHLKGKSLRVQAHQKYILKDPRMKNLSLESSPKQYGSNRRTRQTFQTKRAISSNSSTSHQPDIKTLATHQQQALELIIERRREKLVTVENTIKESMVPYIDSNEYKNKASKLQGIFLS